MCHPTGMVQIKHFRNFFFIWNISTYLQIYISCYLLSTMHEYTVCIYTWSNYRKQYLCLPWPSTSCAQTKIKQKFTIQITFVIFDFHGQISLFVYLLVYAILYYPMTAANFLNWRPFRKVSGIGEKVVY